MEVLKEKIHTSILNDYSGEKINSSFEILYNKINEFLLLGLEVVLVILCILFCGLNKHEGNKILSSLRIILKKVYNS